MNPDTAPVHHGRRVRDWWWRPLAFAAGFVAILAALFYEGRDFYLDGNIADDRKDIERMRERHVLVLGTSHGEDLSLPDAGLNGVNMSHGGQDLFEMAYMARTVKQRAPKLDTVFITLSYFSFSFSNAAFETNGVRVRVGRRIGIYTGFGRLAFIPGDGAEYLKGILYPLITRDHYQTGFEELWAKLTGHPRPIEPDAPPKAERHRSDAWYAKHAKRRCTQFGEQAHNMSEHEPHLAEDTFESTLALARELRAASIRVVFFTPPYLRLYSACFDRRLQDQMRDSAHRLASQSGASYFDFSTDAAFVDRTDFFEDSDHLNERGRVAFSQLLKQSVDAVAR